MKKIGTALALLGTGALIGGGIYMMMQCPDAKKKAGKAILDAMDSAEDMIAKKMK